MTGVGERPGWDEAIERAAEVLYERKRADEYRRPEYDWANLTATSYDREPCDDDGDPDWVRNDYRADVRAVVPVIAAAVLADALRLDRVYDALYAAQYGDRSVGAEEREACAQLTEAFVAALRSELS